MPTFVPKDWKDYPDLTTPITQAALEDLERRVAQAEPRNANTFYPEDYGAVGDGTTDDSAAINACIADAVGAKGGQNATIQFGAKTYQVDGALGRDHNGNSILKIPYVTSSLRYLQLQGVHNYTQIRTAKTGQTYSGSYGPPVVLGGPTPETLGSAALYSLVVARVKDMRFVVPQHTTLGGLDFSRCIGMDIDNVIVTATTYTTPAPDHAWTCGIRTPDTLQWGHNVMQRAQIFGFYCATAGQSDHLQILGLTTNSNFIVLGMVGRSNSATSNHTATWGNIDAAWQAHVVAGWDPANGIGDLSSSGYDYYAAVIQCLDIEDTDPALTGDWRLPVNHIHDNNNCFRAYGYYSRIVPNAGPTAGITKRGGTKAHMTDLVAA